MSESKPEPVPQYWYADVSGGVSQIEIVYKTGLQIIYKPNPSAGLFVIASCRVFSSAAEAHEFLGREMMDQSVKLTTSAAWHWAKAKELKGNKS